MLNRIKNVLLRIKSAAIWTGQFLVSNRMKSLYWRTAMMAASFGVSFAIEHLYAFNVPYRYQTLVGLILGEISKAINNKLMAGRAARALAKAKALAKSQSKSDKKKK